MTGVIRGRLVVGMVTGCTIAPLFDALAAFRLAHPGVEVALLEENSDRLTEWVRSGAADVALIGAAGATPPELEALTIVSESLVAAVAPDHALAARTGVTLTELAAHPVVCLPHGTGVRAVFDRACEAQQVKPKVALEASAPEAVADLAARGLGVAILSESMTAGRGQRLKPIAIADLEIPAILALVWKSDANPALAELMSHMRRAFARYQNAARDSAYMLA